MGILVEWKNDEHTVMVWKFDGRWDWEMLCDAADISTELRRKVEYRQPVTTILDLTSASPVQTGQLVLSLPRSIDIIAPGYDRLILAGREAFNQKTLATFRRLGLDLGTMVHSVSSLPEALHIASQQSV